MPNRNANIPTPLGTHKTKENRRRVFELERQGVLPIGSMSDLNGVDHGGFLDDGFSYGYDYDQGLLTPSRPGVAVFSWLDPPTVGLMSGPHPLLCGYVGKIYQVSAGCRVPDSSSHNAVIGFYLNGTQLTELDIHGDPVAFALTLLSGSTLVSAQYTWPTTGALTDVITVELISYSGSTLAGLTAHAFYL
jgi:hypothetical protein